MPLEIFIPGTPAPQGSMKGYVRGKRVILTSANPATMPWRSHIAATARERVGSDISFRRPHAVWADLKFIMPRRSAEPKRATPAHTRKPDLDKLIRAVLDALTGIVWEDDSQVTRLAVSKRTAEIGEQPGLNLTTDWYL